MNAKTSKNKNVNSQNNLQQQQSQIQKEQQLENQYYIYEDLQNIINLIYARNAVLQHFKNDPDHPLIKISNNKIILQLNLSNSIHLDLQSQQHNKNNDLIKERQKSHQILLNAIQKNGLGLNQKGGSINDKNSLEYQLSDFQQRYKSDKFGINTYKLQETALVAKFDEKVLQQTISSIQTVDSQVASIRQGRIYNTPTEQSIIERAENYQYEVIQKLNKQFPQANFGTRQEERSQNNFEKVLNNGIQNVNQVVVNKDQSINKPIDQNKENTLEQENIQQTELLNQIQKIEESVIIKWIQENFTQLKKNCKIKQTENQKYGYHLFNQSRLEFHVKLYCSFQYINNPNILNDYQNQYEKWEEDFFQFLLNNQDLTKEYLMNKDYKDNQQLQDNYTFQLYKKFKSIYSQKQK